jgi:dihydropteroate synthase
MAGAVNERSERDGSVRSSAPSSPSAGQALAGPAGVEASRVEPSHIEIWGVLNVTPDSFSDGGVHFDREAAYAHAQRMLAEGADVIDVGGASSRPRGATYGEGAATIDAAEEIRRTVPVIEALRARGITAKLSIDTTRAEVAEAALRAGASIVNDVSMGREPALLEVSAAHGAELVLMHTRADGRVDASTTGYGDVVAEVLDELARAVERAVEHGVARERVWIDPGLGFAKTAGQSMALLAATDHFVATGQRVLVGASRKSFLGIGAIEGDEPVPAPTDRLGASVAAATLAALAGAHAVRVHDVHETQQAVRIALRARASRGARPHGELSR